MSTVMELPLVVRKLTFTYRNRPAPALKDIEFEVRPGELLLIAGASGCGKTTLMRCINGLIPRSYKGELKGTIHIFGQDIRPLPLAKISQFVGTVLQDPERQILGAKVVNEVAFGLENLGLPRAEIIQRVDEALAYLKISHLRERETFLLSGGEKQKVALAGVLAMRPRLILLDEPLASLDPASGLETLALVRRLADEGLTIVMVEHRVEDVLKISPDRVMFMQNGAIRYLGDPAGLVNAVDYREVKLPARLIIQKAASEPPVADGQPVPAPIRPTTEPAEPLVRFENVAFGYEAGTEVLHGITLDIHRGDVIAVLGPNGAGKTTFVKHAIGLLKPKAGRVLVNGRDTRESSVAEIAQTLGYVFQSPSHMLFAPTVREELAFGPTNLRHTPAEIKHEVKEALRIVNLEDREQDSPLSLSFGQQKRVSIAAILAMRSRILVMDEPTAGQDYKNYLSFMDAILRLPNFEAILFITHDVDLAVIYANRVIIISDGQVVADGAPPDVLCDFERLRQCRLVPTSLLEANLEHLPRTGRFMRAEALAHI
ncbi:MAG: ABC transporter ATP-binding protein [Anaerolineales bacterium]|nr:ABC transporter ATP-binding protein [Anaerolineales bacterium]